MDLDFVNLEEMIREVETIHLFGGVIIGFLKLIKHHLHHCAK